MGKSYIDKDELANLKELRKTDGPLSGWSFERWDGNGFFVWNGLVVKETRGRRSRRFYLVTYEESGVASVTSHENRVPTDKEAQETLDD